MNYFYKRSNFYYLAIPLAAAVWVLVTSTVLSNSADKRWEKNQKKYVEGQGWIGNILMEDMSILKPEKQLNDKTKFDYTKVFTKFANTNSISTGMWTHRTTGTSTRNGKVTKSANLSIENVDIKNLTRFLTEMLDTWPDLQCNKLTLTKLKTGPDNWKVTEIKFTYTF